MEIKYKYLHFKKIADFYRIFTLDGDLDCGIIFNDGGWLWDSEETSFIFNLDEVKDLFNFINELEQKEEVTEDE